MRSLPDGPTPQRHRATLLEDADIKGWIKDHRSPNTAKTQLEQLDLFCRRTATEPHELVRIARGKSLKPLKVLVNTWADDQRRAGRPDQYLKAVWYAVVSWLRYNEVKIEWSPPFRVEPAATLANERIPTLEELRRVLALLGTRDRAAVLFLTSSGVRIGVLANRFEAGGITLGNLPDLVLSKNGVSFGKTPALVRVPVGLSKSGREYLTFLTTEAAEALVAYLLERMRRGEELNPRSPVMAPEPKASHSHFRKGRDGSMFISGKSLGTVIRTALRKVVPPEVRIRPHTLRAWTSSSLERAEREGAVTRSDREYFLGHNLGSVETRYGKGKRLSQESIEELRAVYKRCEKFLSTAPTAEADLTTKRLVLLAVGYSEEQVDRMNVPSLTPEELIEAVTKSPARTAPRQQLVEESDLPRLLASGWRAVMSANGRFVVERAG